jgi:hypothetical protein
MREFLFVLQKGLFFAAKPDEKTARQRVVLFETPKTPRKTCLLSPQERRKKKDRVETTKPPKKKRDGLRKQRKNRLAGKSLG